MVRRRGRRARRSRRTYFRRAGRHMRRAGGRLRAGVSTIFRGTPAIAKPSNFTAYTGVGSAVLQLVGKPVGPNNDSWFNRLIYGIEGMKRGDSMSASWIGSDGQNILGVAAEQVAQNAPGAIGTVAGFGIVAGIERWLGM